MVASLDFTCLYVIKEIISVQQEIIAATYIVIFIQEAFLLPGFFCAPGGARFRRGTFPEGWFAGMHLVGAMHLRWRCIRIGKILLAGMHLLGRNHPCYEVTIVKMRLKEISISWQATFVFL